MKKIESESELRIEKGFSLNQSAIRNPQSLRARRFKLIVKMPALEQIVEQENDHDRRRDAESDLRIMLFEDVRRMFAVTHRQPAYQSEPDAATYDHRRDESPEPHAEGSG